MELNTFLTQNEATIRSGRSKRAFAAAIDKGLVVPDAVLIGTGAKHQLLFKSNALPAIKRLLGQQVVMVVALALFLAAASSANAQRIGFHEILGDDTAPLLALSTNIYGNTLSCPDFESVGLQLSATCSGSVSGNIVAKFSQSLDSTHYSTSDPFVMVLPLQSSGRNTVISHWEIGSAVFKLDSIENTNAGVYVTNINLRANFKARKIKVKQI